MRILITGGAGFVGSHLARSFKREWPQAEVVCFDNLKRRGSELNLKFFKQENIQFAHGDIRSPSDLADLTGNFDYFIEASAEPSVLAGLNSSPDYLLHTNLVGTLNCLEFAKKRCERTVFLSTSRVYSIRPLTQIKLTESPTRFEIAETQDQMGISPRGVSENFTTSLPRSLYGASKLASELVIQEYADTYKMKAIINRCGVIVGPGQFGKVDQGVFTLWLANHYFKKNLKYTGFGGEGKQVRDLLHPADLFALVKKQFSEIEKASGDIFNVGGGPEVSTSLLELTRICEEITGNKLSIAKDLKTSPVDIPLYISDNSKVSEVFGWKAQKTVPHIFKDIHEWITANEAELGPLFA